ncbi:hypothetical protein ACR3I8_20490 [Priestia flexa]
MDQERLYEQLFSMSLTPMLIMDLNGEVQALNDACAHLFKKEKEQLLSSNVFQHVSQFLIKKLILLLFIIVKKKWLY